MRFAVIADIHGNLSALEAVLADIARTGISEIVNLGDSLCGPLDPAGTADRLMSLGLPTIAGNHDRWLIDRPPEEQPLWEQWSYPLLSSAHLDWVRGLPPLMEIHGVLMTHGTPASDCEDWLHRRGEDGELREAHLWEVAELAGDDDFPVILSGHTHMPRIVRLPDGRLLVNPGAVGCPAYLDDRFDPPRVAEAGAPDARYSVIEAVGNDWHASLHAVPYDPAAMAARAREMGATGWPDALMSGWMRPIPCDQG